MWSKLDGLALVSAHLRHHGFEAVLEEAGVLNEEHAHRDDGEHEDVELATTVSVPLQPVKDLGVVGQVTCKATINTSRCGSQREKTRTSPPPTKKPYRGRVLGTSS